MAGTDTEQRGVEVPAQRPPSEGPLAVPEADASAPAPESERVSRHGGPDDEPHSADTPPPDATRLGAHAAPYMDPDGTLHNLRPIGRLAVSGADEPQRIADTAFGGMWFTRPAEDEPATAAPDTPDPPTEVATAVQPDANDPVQAEEPSRQPTPPGKAAAEQQAAPGQQAKQAEAPSEPVAAQREPDEAGAQDGRVIDLDVSELFKGVTITGEQPAVQDEPVDPASVRARIDERMAAPRMPREREPEPVKERPALSAADLEAIRWRLDGGTLREVVDDREALRELGERLDGPLADEVDNVAKAGLLSVRAEVYRLLGELGMAAAASRLALAHAESARDLQSEVIAQAELAHILRLRGDFKEADRLFAKATGSEVPEALRSVVHENAGRSCFDQGRHMEALDHFARAVRLGRAEDAELAARVGVCLEAVYIHVLRDGWGPYPRTREDILGLQAALEESTAEQPIIPPR